jgi:hypothetical protein
MENADVLRLKGRLQVTTARDALLATGINPEAAQKLDTFLDTHEKLSRLGPKGLRLFMQGGSTERMKADIIMSLELVSSTTEDDGRDFSIAAAGLLELLKED